MHRNGNTNAINCCGILVWYMKNINFSQEENVKLDFLEYNFENV